MPRCSHCGKVNRDGSLFCQDCGHKLEATAAPSAPKPAAATANAVCSSCGTVNPPGMNFCKMCGTSLAAKAPAAPAAEAAPPGKLSCPSCGKQTPSGFSFCQHCGQRLGVGQAAAAPVAAVVPAAITNPSPPPQMSASVNALGIASTIGAAVSPTPPAGMPRPSPVAAAPARPAPITSGDALAQTIAPPQLSVSAPARAVPQSTVTGRDTLMDPPAPSVPVGNLIAVNRDGSDGQAVPIFGETFDIGRTEGHLKFLEDPYLAPRHARLLAQNGKVVVRPIDGVNGVYLRVQGGGADLSPGDQFLVGKELLRYEPLAPEERDPPSLVEHGVRIFGTVPREAWGRLRQLTVAGTTRDLWHLTRPELVLGREEGDVTFPDDEFMSRRHAALKRVGAKAKLEDLNSSNGTFVRVRGDRELKPGDVLRMGDQLLRFEA